MPDPTKVADGSGIRCFNTYITAKSFTDIPVECYERCSWAPRLDMNHKRVIYYELKIPNLECPLHHHLANGTGK